MKLCGQVYRFYLQISVNEDISQHRLSSLTWRLFLCVRQIIGTRAHFRNSISNAQSMACIVEREGKGGGEIERKEG
jgi:hypothetical protein